MEEIIRVKNASYDLYEELLVKRDAYKKEAFELEREYTRTFGECILSVFRLKVECIRKKKTIEFCQRALNHGKNVNQDELQKYLESELAEFQTQIDRMIKRNEAAKSFGMVSDADLLEIKRIYHKLVKKIHPDINPETNKNDKLQALWQQLVLAYNCNDLKLMQETEVYINRVLEELGSESICIDIPNIDEKIEEVKDEIEKIITTTPYTYKYILLDDEKISEKQAELDEEKKHFEEYSNSLDEVLNGLLGNGVHFTWQMN